MTNTEIIANLATIIAKQNLEISELNTEVQHLHHELLATMNEADRKTEPTISKMEQVDKDINVRSKDEPQTESLEQFRVGLEYHTDTTHFGKTKGESVTTNKIEDEPQTERSGR